VTTGDAGARTEHDHEVAYLAALRFLVELTMPRSSSRASAISPPVAPSTIRDRAATTGVGLLAAQHRLGDLPTRRPDG